MSTALDCFISALDDMDLIGTKELLFERFMRSAQYPRKKKKHIRKELISRLIFVNLLIKIQS
jgi:hypothetical protein